MTKIRTSSNLNEVILEDVRVKRLFKAKDSGTFAINTKELMDELQDLMVTRKYANLKVNEFISSAQKRSVGWQLELSAFRSRATLIKMTTFAKACELEERLKSTKRYILSTYNNEIGVKYTSITAKNAYVDNLLNPLQRIMYKLESVQKMADMLIADLDQGSRGNYNVVEALKINYKGN